MPKMCPASTRRLVAHGSRDVVRYRSERGRRCGLVCNLHYGGSREARLATQLDSSSRRRSPRLVRGLAKSRFTSLDARFYEVADAAWGDLLMVLYELETFRNKHPDGGVYDGYRICSLEAHAYKQSELDRLVRQYVTKRPQRVRGALAAGISRVTHRVACGCRSSGTH